MKNQFYAAQVTTHGSVIKKTILDRSISLHYCFHNEGKDRSRLYFVLKLHFSFFFFFSCFIDDICQNEARKRSLRVFPGKNKLINN